MSLRNERQKELLNAARRGDDDALGELIGEFQPMLRSKAVQSLANLQHRIGESDIVQMTWWSAFRAFPRFEGDVDAFVGWLRNIHECNIKDAVRDQYAEKRSIDLEVSSVDVMPGAREMLPSPSQMAVRREQHEQMETCLMLLPTAQREVIRLRYYDGHSVAEIVQRMGRSETAVAGLLKRGLSTLRKLMGEQQDE